MAPRDTRHENVSRRRVPVSIVCVYNDVDVLSSCLQSSVNAQIVVAPQTELLAIDNRESRFATAGAALNHGAREAKNEVIVFVHQDVVLHSLPELEVAAGELLDAPDIGIMGAVGIDNDRRVIGRIRDRIVQIGDPARQPHDVDTLDEVLLMMPTARVLAEPISEDALLAWHAYGVEYAVRMRRQGLRAVARDIPLTHNSLSTNLDKLDLAHRHVGDTYPELLPIHTTCGTVYADGAIGAMTPWRRRYNSARMWWNESLVARTTKRISPASDRVIADIRMLIDDAAELSGKTSLKVLDLDPQAVADYADDLMRFERHLTIESTAVSEAVAVVEALRPDELLFIAGLTDESLTKLAPFAGQPHVLGNSDSTGRWALVGVSADEVASLWSTWRHRPVPGIA